MELRSLRSSKTTYQKKYWGIQQSSLVYYASGLALIILGIIFYLPSLHYDFQFDDVANITRQFTIRSHTFWNLFMTGPRWMSYWLNTLHYSIGKFNPFSYRLANVLLHSLSSLLLFSLILKLLENLKAPSFFKKNAYFIALSTAVIFLLHPVQTQTISYVIQGQLEGMAAFFMLACLLTFFYSTQATTKLYEYGWFSLSLLTAFLATGCKEIVIVLPVLAILVDWFFIAQGDITQFKKTQYKHIALSLLVIGLYVYFLKPSFFMSVFGLKLKSPNNIGNVLTHNDQESILPLPFFISQFKVILHYLQIFVWPFTMSVEYDWKLVTGFFCTGCLLPLGALLSLLYLTLRFLQQNKIHPLAFGSLWFFLSVLPRSSIIPSSELLADYKTYVPSIGICFILGCALVGVITYVTQRYSPKNFKHTKNIPLMAIAIVALGLGLATVSRNRIWRTAEDFWFNIIKNAPGKARAYNNYAVALSERGAYKEAIPFFEKAISMDGRYPDPLNNVAVAYLTINDLDKALEVLKESVRLNPSYPEAYNNLATIFIKQDKLDYAEHMLSVAIKLRPYYGKAFFNLAKVCLMRNDHEKAHGYLKKACLEADFDNETGFKVYADISAYLNKAEDALIAYGRLVQLAPSAENIFGLANAHLMVDQVMQAIALYEKVLRINPQEGRYWYNLAEAYIKNKSFQQALDAFNHPQIIKKDMPTLCLRQAYCYDQLGNKLEAIKSAQEALQYPNLPVEHRTIAQSMLAQAQHEGWLQKI